MLYCYCIVYFKSCVESLKKYLNKSQSLDSTFCADVRKPVRYLNSQYCKNYCHNVLSSNWHTSMYMSTP